MMRETTREKYRQSLVKLTKENTKFKYDAMTSISRNMFGNFVVMHYLRKAGCLIEHPNKTYSVNSAIPVDAMLSLYEKQQYEAGMKAMRKDREKKKQLKESLQLEEKKRKAANITLLNFEQPVKKEDQKEATASELVAQLRSMGYEVTCKKVIEL